MRDDLLLELADLASEQWGLFTSAQAKRVGATAQQLARLANNQVVDRLRHGVYRVVGVPEDSRTSLRAAWLALDPSRTASERHHDAHPGVVSHRSAAWSHGLGDLEADDLEFSVPARRQSRRSDTRFHVRELSPDDWELLEGLPVTTVTTTVVDLAEARIDGGHLAGVVRDALVDAHAELPVLATALRPFAHRYGSRLGDGEAFVEDLLDQAGVPTSTLAAAAAASSRRASQAEHLLASPTVFENLQLLQSSALQQNLAQLSAFTQEASNAALLERTRQLFAEQAKPTDLVADMAKQLSAMHNKELQKLQAQFVEAAQQLVTNPVKEAADHLARLQLGTASAAAVADPVVEASRRALHARLGHVGDITEPRQAKRRAEDYPQVIDGDD